MVAERASVFSSVTPSASMVTVTSRPSPVPLRTSVRSVTSSPTRRNRGSAGRTISGCVTSSSLSPSPACVAVVVARASARQVVVLSGRCSSKLVEPSSSVVSWLTQSAVFRKSERTSGPLPAGALSDATEAASSSAIADSATTPDSATSERLLAARLPSPSSPTSASRYVSFQRSTWTDSDEAVCTPSARSNQNASMPSGPPSRASASTALSTMATETSAATPSPSASVTVIS